MADNFGDWIRGESIGEGGQSRTYFAYKKGDRERKPFVIKVLKQKSNPARLKRFEREISVGRQLSHTNVVHIEAEDLTADQPYLIMEYCSGGELQDFDISSLSILQKLTLFEKVCEGVAHLHANGVIHRDLKPSNIFLRDDTTPVVGDLGLCLLTELDERLTETGEAIGARLFMAPELEDGRFEDAKYVADIYSLGKILYWLVANRKIFNREKHRNEHYDLTIQNKTAALAFIYQLLDGSIKPEPTERAYSDGEQLLSAVQKTIGRIATMAHAVDRDIAQDCTYCGAGTYQVLAEGQPAEQGFAYKASYPLGITLNNVASYDDHRWLVMACDYCGNLQWFRMDQAKRNPKAWQSGSMA